MGKIVDEYEKIKAKDKETLLLFKMGKFYIFIGDDADYINKYMVLKKLSFLINMKNVDSHVTK